MRNSKVGLTIVLFATVFTVSLWSAKADSPKPEKTASKSNNAESLDVRFARAHLELAKLDLRRAMEANKRIPNLMSAAFFEELRLHAEIDEERLEQCLMGEDADSHQICIRSAEAAVKIAEADLKRKRTRHQRMPSTFSKLHVERAEVSAELAKLNLERAQELDGSEAAWTHLQWQIDELRHQVLELQTPLKR